MVPQYEKKTDWVKHDVNHNLYHKLADRKREDGQERDLFYVL